MLYNIGVIILFFVNSYQGVIKMGLLFDKEQFKELMNDFYIITNIKIVFYNNNLEPVISIPENDCEFCTLLKNNDEALKKCMLCIQKEVEKCREENHLNIYKCHCGLTEAVAPIKIDDIIIGYIMFGQVIDEEDLKENKEKIIEYASRYCKKDMSECFNEITIKNVTQIHSVAKFMEACISYLVMNKLIKNDYTSLEFKITTFIENNLDSDLSVDLLCTYFQISRNSLYKIFNDFYGMSVAKYIRKKRVEAAIDLINSGVSVADASSRVGFCDYNYFSKVFKTQTGVLPTKFKKRLQSKNDKLD